MLRPHNEHKPGSLLLNLLRFFSLFGLKHESTSCQMQNFLINNRAEMNKKKYEKTNIVVFFFPVNSHVSYICRE